MHEPLSFSLQSVVKNTSDWMADIVIEKSKAIDPIPKYIPISGLGAMATI